MKNLGQEILMVGTGYVGLVTAVGLAELGHTVACNDIDPRRIEDLQNGIPPFLEPGVPELLRKGIDARRLSFSQNLAEAYSGQRYVCVAVQTPIGMDGKTDLSAVHTAVRGIARVVDRPTLVVIKSTVPVDVFSTLSMLPEVIESGHLTFIACPEFLAEGTAMWDFFHPRRTIVGSDNEEYSREIAGLFHGLGGSYVITDAKTAQLIKYSANTFLATRVAFINEISQICDQYSIDAHDVVTALTMDPRVGNTYLNPSIGFGGPCLPKDLAALIQCSTDRGVTTPLLSGVATQNIAHLQYRIDEMVRSLGDGRKVAVLGLSFKPDTDDVRNSFSLTIIQHLLDAGITVHAMDPHAIRAAARFLEHPELRYFDNVLAAAAGTDLQIFFTPWSQFGSLDLDRLAAVVARPNIYDCMRSISQTKAVEAGFAYHGVGQVNGGRTKPTFEVSDNPALH